MHKMIHYAKGKIHMTIKYEATYTEGRVHSTKDKVNRTIKDIATYTEATRHER